MTIESAKVVAGGVEAEAPLSRLPYNDAGQFLPGAIDGVSFGHDFSFAGGKAVGSLSANVG